MAKPQPGLVLACLLITSSLLPLLSVAVKTEEFRSCDQASFCRRNRHRDEKSSTLVLKEKLRDLGSGAFTGKVTDVVTGAELQLDVSAYASGSIRVKLNEGPNRKHERFEVPDVLVNDLESKRIPLVEEFSVLAKESRLKSGPHTVVIKHDPLQIDVFTDNHLIISINGRGLLNFEAYRDKLEGDENGLWEEPFRTHTDSKPKGPASVAFDSTFHNTLHVYGLPERATSLALKPTKGENITSEPYRLFNLDVFEYVSDSPFGLYGSVPFLMGVGREMSAGLFWLNAAEMFVDVLAPTIEQGEGGGEVDTHWIAESGIIDLFILLGPSPKEVIQQYTALTGTTALPQLFSTAYHQCRWNYKDEGDVFGVDMGFDEHDIPYDVLWLDIEHTDAKKYFTWDKALFPNPKGMQEKLAAKGRKMVTIIDPHIKRDDSYPIHKEAAAKGYYVKNKEGKDFEGWCWPGSSSYLDMVNPDIRSWWADKFAYENYLGSTPTLYTWNDMNEPSVFNGPELTMPRDALHHGNVEHRDVHNAYGFYFHMASAEGLARRARSRDRPFVLSRALFAGTQRVGAIWTGDNTAAWEHLRASIPMVLTLGIAGVANAGADVGGFFGNPEAELLVRWYQLGAFYPFFRAHAHLETKRREPWLFGPEVTGHIRSAVQMRYRILPYVYTLFREANTTGLPLMRPLWLEYPTDVNALTVEDSFLLGSDLLIRGVMEKGASSVSVYFPGAESEPWYDISDGRKVPGGAVQEVPIPGLHYLPVFQRGGSIIARKERARRSSKQMEHDPYTLVVAVNSTGAAEGTLYMDDGHSYAFVEGGFLHRRFVFKDSILYSEDAAPQGSSGKGYSTDCDIERVVFLGLDKGGYKATVEKEGRGGPVDVVVQSGALGMEAGRAVTVKRPGLLIAGSWSLRLSRQ